MRVEFFTDRSGGVRWRIVAGNGHILADSGQGYSRITDARRGCEAVTGRAIDLRAALASAPIDGAPRWPVRDLREGR